MLASLTRRRLFLSKSSVTLAFVATHPKTLSVVKSSTKFLAKEPLVITDPDVTEFGCVQLWIFRDFETLRIVPSSGISRRVVRVWTNVSEKVSHPSSGSCYTLVSCSAVFRSWKWRRYVPPKRRFTYGVHGAISPIWFPLCNHLMCLCLLHVLAMYTNRDGPVGIATGYRLDDQAVGVRVPVGSRILLFPRYPDRLWGPPSLLANE
jgi:hypothetical protein